MKTTKWQKGQMNGGEINPFHFDLYFTNTHLPKHPQTKKTNS